jgi:hypothetical protein
MRTRRTNESDRKTIGVGRSLKINIKMDEGNTFS